MKERILIIDDDIQICDVLVSYLGDHGYNAYSCLSLEAAREELKKTPLPDIILLDVMLKDGNGLIFLRELKRVSETGSIPVIMISALRNRGEDRVAGLEYGAEDYLGKPFDLHEMAIRIERILKRHVGKLPETVPNTPPEPLVRPTPTEDFIEELETPAPDLKYLFGLLLLSPKDFFHFDFEDLKIRLGWICLLLASVAFGIQVGFQDKSVGNAFVNALAFAAILTAVTAALAWGLQWAMGLRRTVVKFPVVWMVARLALAPLVISSFLGILYVAFANGAAGDFTAGPLLIFPSQISSNTLGTILRHSDIFELWCLFLFAFGLRKIMKVKRRLLLTWVFATWGLVLVIFGFLRGLF